MVLWKIAFFKVFGDRISSSQTPFSYYLIWNLKNQEYPIILLDWVVNGDQAIRRIISFRRISQMLGIRRYPNKWVKVGYSQD